MRSPRWIPAVVALLSGCAGNLYDHETVATVGFVRTPRVVVIELTTDPGLADAARREVLAAARPEVLAIQRVVLADERARWEIPPQAACQREVLGITPPPPPEAAPAAGPEVEQGTETEAETETETETGTGTGTGTGQAKFADLDLVLVIDTRSTAQAYDRCPVLNRRLRSDPGTGGTITIDPSADELVVRSGDTGGLRWTCTKFEYSHTVATATANVYRLNPDCTHHDGDAIPATSEVRVASGDKAADLVRARARARGQTLVGPLRANGRGLLPRGLHLASQDGTRVALEGAVTLGGDNPFRIAARRGDGRATASFIIDRATPSGLTGDAFTLTPPNEADGSRDKVRFQLRLGDEVQRRTYSHELKLLPLVSAGTVRADGGAATTLAAVASLRWSYPRLFTAAEAAYSHGLEFDQDSRRREGTLALGPAVRLHPVRVRAYGEANLVSLRSTAIKFSTALETQFGAGVGVDVWIRKEVITLDLRHRWSTALRSTDAAGPPAIEDASVWLVQLGYAFRIDQPKGEPALPRVGTAAPR
jgi:hypothetical protein